MTAPRDRRLALLDELASADEERAAALAQLERLSAETEELRRRSEDLAALVAGAPDERAKIEAHLGAAQGDVRSRERELAGAETLLADAERAGDEERVAEARRAIVRARDGLSVARRQVAAREEELAELDRRVEEAAAVIPRVEARATKLAHALGSHGRLAREAAREPAPGLAGVVEWASGVRAALAVARGGLAAERDAIVRQANELGSVLLGEPLVASSVASVARRIERELAG